ncbi:MAG: 30S ribosomal protein S16 [Desulfovibrio sp.]|jgi:small subunit ribosomal protein S16|nr:30S ribosomal protein S16 [Desulfovibrio sp.]
MAVKMRLTRMGSKKRPFYRVVVTNSGTRRDGRPLDFIGWYNPMTEPAKVEIDKQKARKWLEQGAEASETVKKLLKEMR